MGIEDLTPKKDKNPIINTGKQEVVDMIRVLAINELKANPESPEAVEAFETWYEREYEKFVQAGERDPYPLDWSVAELYIEAELYEKAYDKLNELADVAWKARDDEWIDKVNAKFDEIDDRSKK